jgi:bisphosphoglycerate-dependent phosphoglycerate mutase
MTEEPCYEDLTGQRFGKLRVLSKAEGHDKQDRILWNCVCDCGKEITAPGRELRNGYRRSCGCRSKLYKSKHFVDGICVELIRSRTIAKNNTSGVRGVYKSGNRKKWCAQITFQGKTRYLGSFNTLEEAAEARSRGENLFNEFLARYDAENPSKQKNASAPGIG